MNPEWNHKIFTVTQEGFDGIALDIFRYQYSENPVYRQFVNALHVRPESVTSLVSVPFLPIGLFKSSKVYSHGPEPDLVFESSGTTGLQTSRHFVRDPALYRESFLRGFESVYGSVQDQCIIGLLPGYLERQNSSLVYMVNQLVELSRDPDSGFYLHDHEQLAGILGKRESQGKKTILIGVSFALLDFAERYPMKVHHTVIMETGGMKGRRRELIRQELHDQLKQAFSAEAIHSEYGMTELLSQAYAVKDGVFRAPSWMRVMIRDDEDPGLVKKSGSGALNIIDLANIYSCSFIATEDAGKVYADGTFEVLGRMDNTDLRGCSMLV